jgi:hypothetical protein
MLNLPTSIDLLHVVLVLVAFILVTVCPPVAIINLCD